MGYSFRNRLLSCLGAILLLALFVPGYYYSREVSQDLQREEVKRAKVILKHVEHMLINDLGTVSSVDQLQKVLEEMGQSLQIRITCVDVAGSVLADSEVPLARLETLGNHAFRPEIVQAKTEDYGVSIRFSTTLSGKPKLLYLAKAANNLPLMERGYLRLAVPYSSLQGRLDRLTREYLVILAISFAVFGLVGMLLVRQLTRSFQMFIEAADAVGSGDFDRRIRVTPGREFEPLALAINRMAGNIGEQIKTITEQKGQIETVLNGIREGVAVLDNNGIIRDANVSFGRIFRSSSKIQGLRPLELVRSPQLQEAVARVLDSRRAGNLEQQEMQLELEGNRFFDVSVVPLQVQDANLAAVMVFHDITESKRLDKVRRDFVANVSHELRTPLTSIKGYAETVMASEDMDRATKESFLSIIIKNTNNMSNLVRDLLQLAKLESVEAGDKLEPVDVCEAMQDAWKACAALANEKSVTLDKQVPGELPKVSYIFDQLVQVFRNLFENAVKYSPRGSSITVFHSLDDHTLTLGVVDRGPGVPKPDQERIFERFYRVEKHRNKELSGTGLGLAICRHILRNHGGRIWVESPPRGSDIGSVFFFTIRLKARLTSAPAGEMN